MLRTGVVSQRLVLQVVHMEQLVAETCRCDLSPSVSRPLVINWINEEPVIVKLVIAMVRM